MGKLLRLQVTHNLHTTIVVFVFWDCFQTNMCVLCVSCGMDGIQGPASQICLVCDVCVFCVCDVASYVCFVWDQRRSATINYS